MGLEPHSGKFILCYFIRLTRPHHCAHTTSIFWNDDHVLHHVNRAYLWMINAGFLLSKSIEAHYFRSLLEVLAEEALIFEGLFLIDCEVLLLIWIADQLVVESMGRGGFVLLLVEVEMGWLSLKGTRAMIVVGVRAFAHALLFFIQLWGNNREASTSVLEDHSLSIGILHTNAFV